MVRIANDTAGGGDRETVFVQSLQRGLAVIRAFDADNAALTLGDVAKSTNLARAAARRFVLTLVELGYVRVDGRLFRLSPRVLELGRPYLSSLTLPEIARPRQQAFVDAVRESSSLAILDDTDIVYVSHVAADRIMAVVVAVGTRDPAVTTSLGRVLLAGQSQEWLRTFLAAHRLAHRTEHTIVDPERLLDELLRIREQGYALVDQELEEGLRALAVPLRDASGQVVAAVNVAVHASRWPLDAIRGELLPRLQELASEIDQDAVEAAARVTPAIPAQRREPAPEPAVEETNGNGGDERETVFVQSLQRGLAVIRAFDAEHPALTLSDVARATGLARAAARRFLLTLVELGYVRADGRLFRLTPRVLELGRPYLSSLTLPEIALPHMRDLVGEAQESATLAVLDGGDIVYVAHVSARRILSVSVSVGERDPAVATSLGRALLASQEDGWLLPFLAGQKLTRRTPQTIVDPQELLAELHRIRAQGYALVDQELEEGLRALSVPIRDARGQVVAAMNVAVHASRWTVEAIGDELLPKLLQTAAAIDRDLLATAVPPRRGVAVIRADSSRRLARPHRRARQRRRRPLPVLPRRHVPLRPGGPRGVDDDLSRCVAAAPGVVFVGTASYGMGHLPVRLEFHEQEPALDLQAFDRVADVSLEVRGNELFVGLRRRPARSVRARCLAGPGRGPRPRSAPPTSSREAIPTSSSCGQRHRRRAWCTSAGSPTRMTGRRYARRDASWPPADTCVERRPPPLPSSSSTRQLRRRRLQHPPRGGRPRRRARR